MAIDPNIALGYRSPQINVDIQTPVQRFATVMSLRDMMTRQQMGQMQLQEAGLQLQRAQQEQRERQALADWYTKQTQPDANGNVQPFEFTPQKAAELRAVAPNFADDIIKKTYDTMESQAKAQHEQYTVLGDRANRTSSIVQGMVDEPSKLVGLNTLLTEKLISPQERDFYNNIPADSDQFRNLKQGIIQQALKSTEYLTQQREAEQLKIQQAQENRAKLLGDYQLSEARDKALAMAAQTVPSNQKDWDTWWAGLPKGLQSRISPIYSPVAEQKIRFGGLPIEKQMQYAPLTTMTDADWQKYVTAVVPDTSSPLYNRTMAQVNLYRSQGKLKEADDAVKAAGEQLGKTESAVATARATVPFKVEVAQQGAIARADAAGLTDDDYQRAGEQYARTGVMPAMGRDSITRGKIVHYGNQWARDNGLNPSDLLQMQAAYAGDKESLKKFQSQRDQIVSFENTAKKNLDLFLSQAQKIVDSGVPWINKPLRTIGTELGSTDLAAVNAARNIANNEVAKVTSGGGLGGVLSDSARHEVEAYNPRDATFAQTVAVANILKQDMANRHQSMDATLSDIKSRIGGGGTSGGGGGGQTYKKTATGPNGHKIGTNDNGATWYDVATGKKL